MTNKPIFRSAITDDSGDVDVGYLALIWGLIGWGVSVLVVLGIGIFAIWTETEDTAAVLQSIGSAEISISSGFAAMLGAVGVFRYGDRARPTGAGTVTTKEVTVTSSPDRRTVPTTADLLVPRGSPTKPIHVALEDDDDTEQQVGAAAKAHRRPAGKKKGT